MISGVLYALLAGLMWGLIFVGPLIVPDYPALLQSMGRYLALGLIALPIAWLGRTRLRQLTRKDWFTALSLTLDGQCNLLRLPRQRYSANRRAGFDDDHRDIAGRHSAFR
ncbi:membrane protein [Salmonella enterica subsp. enterica serovar Daytona]|uniref:Membrane protein n=1 Tax=Salmonella enterica subsp. enterica serovar Daytona TaxID=1962639 RepID=A0A447JPL7_SALET|nr:membrane protein [Salmonella enterica subsp. enterica serovar Daytona]